MAGAFCVEGGVFMYPVSEAFLRAVQENTRRYYWTGRITTKGGAVYPFGYEDIVKGSGYISAQCCGSVEIELYCPTGRMHRESPYSRVRMRKALAEDTLVRLVRKQAELLLEAEKVLKGRNPVNFFRAPLHKSPKVDIL